MNDLLANPAIQSGVALFLVGFFVLMLVPLIPVLTGLILQMVNRVWTWLPVTLTKGNVIYI